MVNAQRKPFDFEDFAAAPAREAAPAPLPTPLTRADVEAARLDGFAAGLAEARAETAAKESVSLASIAELLGAEASKMSEALETEISDLNSKAASFVEQFTRKIASAREIETATDLLRRLLAASPDRAPAALYLNPKSLTRLRKKLASEIAAQGAAAFVSLEGDASLQPGECRLVWRGGAASRRLAPAIAQIDRLFKQNSIAPAAKPVRRKKNPKAEASS